MEKKIKYNFELKFKFLKFLYRAGVITLLRLFPKNWYLGGNDFGEYGIYNTL